MKSKIVVFAFSLLTLLVLGCKPKQAASTPVTAPVVATDACVAVSRGTAMYKEPFSTISHALEGDCLYLKYTYSGGCQEHDIDLYWSGDWAETVPPVTHLYLSHDGHGDGCEAIKSGKKGFDLKELRYAGLGQVIVDVHVDGAPLMRVNYLYSAK
jgi:hypothetical protein